MYNNAANVFLESSNFYSLLKVLHSHYYTARDRTHQAMARLHKQLKRQIYAVANVHVHDNDTVLTISVQRPARTTHTIKDLNGSRPNTPNIRKCGSYVRLESIVRKWLNVDRDVLLS